MLRHKSDPGFTQLMCTDAEHATDDDGSRNKRRGTELRLVLVMATNVGASDDSHDVFLSSLPAEYQQNPMRIMKKPAYIKTLWYSESS